MACRSQQYSGSTTESGSWFNWADLAGGAVAKFHEPGSLADIVRVVQDSQAAGKRVRVVGSGWAFEDIACSPEVMLSLVRLNKVLNYVTDPVTGALLSRTTSGGRTLVHVEAGMKVSTLNLQLAARNLAMPTLGGSNGQSIVGALATSTHGGDFDEPPFCDLIHAIHLVGVGGQEYWIERASAPITTSARLGRVLPCPDTLVVRDDEVFDAIAVGLGRFGAIYSVILETVPAFSLARERTLVPFARVVDALRNGITQGTFLEPLLRNLPVPSSSLNAQSTRPRGMDLIIDSRNTASVHVVRRWLAAGPDTPVGGGGNPLCDLGAAGVLTIGAVSIPFFGMNPFFLSNRWVLFDPRRWWRLKAKQAELLARIGQNMTPGEALAVVTNAYWDFDITRVPDALAFFVFQQQFSALRGPSYSVMTGSPTYDANGTRLLHELHGCYRANSCEIVFDAADTRYIDFVIMLVANAPNLRQAGYISLRYSRRSRAPLSMHNVVSDHAVSIEVSTPRYMYDSTAWIDFVLLQAQLRGGRPHWGQQNRLSSVQTLGLYGARLDRWCAALAGLNGSSTLFSNTFTVSRGLEPRGKKAIQFERIAKNATSSVIGPISMLLLDDEPHQSVKGVGGGRRDQEIGSSV